MLLFLDNNNVTMKQKGVILKALELYKEYRIDFVDCIIISYSLSGYSIFTFDKKINSLIKNLSNRPG